MLTINNEKVNNESVNNNNKINGSSLATPPLSRSNTNTPVLNKGLGFSIAPK